MDSSTTQTQASGHRGRKSPNVLLPAAMKPPQNPQAEQVVLGALLLEKDAYTEVGELLRPESFYDPQHRVIFEAIRDLILEQKPADVITVIRKLREKKQLEAAGGDHYVTLLSTQVTSTAHLETHARIMHEHAIQRELIGFSNEVIKYAYDDSIDVKDTMQMAESRLFEITQQNDKNEVVPVSSVLQDAMRQIEAAYIRKDGISGLNSGFTDIDALTSGWQNSDLVIIAARPAMGKTAFVLSMAKSMAMDFNLPVAIFSLEMSKVQLLNRLIVNHCEIENEKIKRGDLSADEWRILTERVSDLYQAPLYLDDTAGLSVFDLRSKARRLVREHDVKMIIIDYLQLMTASGMKSNANREQEVSMISRSLKHLAKELNIPIIALSQLNRGVESRTGEAKRPQLSDLRESGAIEQDADMVCFIHRPEYYKIFESEDGKIDYRGMAEFIIAKHRNGPTDIVLLRFRGELLKFCNGHDLDIHRNSSMRTVQSGMNNHNRREEEDLPPH